MVKRGAVAAQWLAALMLAASVLTAAAWSRGAEYDEQYTLFLTGASARPAWPSTAFAAGIAQTVQTPQAGLGAIARDLRQSDVHPPLYFWTVALWRRVVGPGLFAARLYSVLCGVAALALVGLLARQGGVPPVTAMLLTLGCYGFAYTSVVARGFALAQLLTLAGVACTQAARGRIFHMTAAGALLGAATAANYLAVFVGMAAVAAQVVPGSAAQASHRAPALRPAGVDGACRSVSSRSLQMPCLPLLAGALPFLLLDLWFFLAQRHSRTGQFPPFEPIAAIGRLARYGAAAVFGGLPLYVDTAARLPLSLALGAVLLGVITLVWRRWNRTGRPHARRLFALAAVAPPCGLLALGVAFDNTPIELRYLAFATPFIGLLLAGALPRGMVLLVLGIQALALAGLLSRPETMQPSTATAAAAVALADDGVVLLPAGNDGVGIVGAFAGSAPPGLLLLVIRQDDPPDGIRHRLARHRRVILALLGQDDASKATLPRMRAAVATPCWQPSAEGFNVAAYTRVCDQE